MYLSICRPYRPRMRFFPSSSAAWVSCGTLAVLLVLQASCVHATDGPLSR